jgi:dTDP-4-amino-4,6-dideoxygalactose transaminase
VSDRLVRLPFFTGMTEADQARVIDVILAFAT